MKRSLAVLAMAGVLGLACVSLPAAAQPVDRETLVVLPDGQRINAGLIKISWRDNTNVSPDDWLIHTRERNWTIPSDFFISTESANGDTIHIWTFEPGFTRKARLDRGRLVIPRPVALEDCFLQSWFENKRSKYHAGTGVPELLSGIILFGHMRSVCENEGPGARTRATLAKQYVVALYALLRGKVENTFSGHQCSLNSGCS